MPSILKHLTFSTGLWATLLTGCVVDAPLPDEVDDTPLAPRSAVLDAVCSTTVHIGRCTGTCDSFGSWDGKQLFTKGSTWLKNNGGPIPSALDEYYQFTWTDAQPPTETELADIYEEPQIEALGPNCVAMSAQTSPTDSILTETLGPVLRDIFHVRTGRASGVDIGLPATSTPEPRVTVMVVDTQPNNLVVEPTSKHGLQMGNIIADLACPDDLASCRTEIEYVVGLPRDGLTAPDYIHGGIVGTHADLALGIYEALRRWEEANTTRATPSQLIINLSVGWEPIIFGGDEAAPTAAVEAIRTALQLASCKGALIVAATGNEGDFCGTTGPLLPGGWETLPAPDAMECQLLGAPGGTQLGSYQPLVHAVGGMDSDLSPMPGTRDNANPRLVGAATNVVAGDPLHGGLTGTSVGAAVATAAAALVWSYRDTLTGSEVMDRVYDSGGSLGGTTGDFALSGTTPAEIRHVDACAALEAACNEPNANCPPMPLTCSTALPPSSADIAAALSALSSVHTVALSPVSLPVIDSSCVDTCGTPVTVQRAAGSTPNCAAFTVDPTDHLINPTPDSIGCPTCGLQNAVLSLSLHPDYDEDPVEAVFVELIDAGGTVMRFDLGAIELSSTLYTQVPIQELSPTTVIRSGDIIIEFESETVTTDALLVY